MFDLEMIRNKRQKFEIKYLFFYLQIISKYTNVAKWLLHMKTLEQNKIL